MRYLTAIKLVVGALLILFLVRHTGDLRQVAALLAEIRLPELAAAVLAFTLAVTFNALRWRLVLSRMGASISPAVTLAGTFEGMFFNLFLPTGVGGDVARAYRAYDSGLGVADVIHSALIDRALGLWGLSLFLLVAIPFSGLVELDLLAWGLVALATCIVAGGLIVASVSGFVGRLSVPAWMRRPRELVVRYGYVVLSRRFGLNIVPVLLASNLAICLSAWLAFRSVGVSVPFADAATIIETASLSALLPVTIGGWGLREGVVIFLLEGLGVGVTQSAAASAIVGLTVLAMGAVGLVVWYAYPYRGPGRSRARRRSMRSEHTDVEPDL